MGLLFLEHNRYYQAFPRLCFLIFFGLSQAKSGSYIRITNITSPTVSECVYISRVQEKSFLKLAIWASPWADLGGGCRGWGGGGGGPPPPPPPPRDDLRFSNTTGILYSGLLVLARDECTPS